MRKWERPISSHLGQTSMVNKGFLKGCKRVFFLVFAGEAERYVCPWSEFQNQSFFVLRRKPCHCQYLLLLVFALFSVAVTVSAISAVLRHCFKAMSCVGMSPDWTSNLVFIDHSLDLMARRALTGLRNIIPTIMIGNMEMELPAMYMMNRFIGICLNGPSAISHDFWK